MRGLIPIKGRSFGALHRTLRAETRSDHLTIDRLMLRFDLAHREDYGIFLNIHHSALQNLKLDWRAEDQEDFADMMRSLQEDLNVLGISTMTFEPLTRTHLTLSNRLGVAYVIRGSRLGSSFLRRRVPAPFASSYLDFSPAMSWVNFLEQLDDFADDSESKDSHEVIHGARWTFELFRHLTTQALS